MKPRNQGGVVDERLNIYSTTNLKVAGKFVQMSYPWSWAYYIPFADMSIIPGNVGANTYNTAIAIGEKAAVIIAQDLGINGITEL